MAKGSRTPNDDRSDSKNTNNPAYQPCVDNRADQLNPDHEAYHASRGEKDDDEEDQTPPSISRSAKQCGAPLPRRHWT